MNNKLKDAAKLRGEARTAQVKVNVRNAMATIRKEMKKNDGTYPENGGAVSMNEVARRAKISQTTLFSPKQKALGRRVKAWVESLKKKEVVGRIRVRRTFYERADDWRKKFQALQDAHIATELELQDATVLLEKIQEDVAKLRAENTALIEHIRTSGAMKVLRIPSRN